ncbi:MAG: aminotransferase class V-fold PLP-dependent enzyme [Candidatus Bathyarchaeia archaeon]
MLDVGEVRKDFQILSKGVIYLDNAASSLTPRQVVDKEMEFYQEYRANVERGVHKFSQKASEEYEKAHSIVADFIGAPSADNIIMTKNTTEGINFVANSYDWKKGDKVVTTILEHHSNFITWIRVAKRYGCTLEVIKSDKEGHFSLADFEKAIDDRTRLVAVTRVSNVLGCITPVKEIASIAHEHGALVLEDGAQSVPHLKTNVKDSKVDFLAFSGHKMLGPTGSGVLYIADSSLYSVEPLCIGGGTIADVSLDGYELAEPPLRFEAGTPAIAQSIGLGEACKYLKRLTMEYVEERDRVLTKRLVEGLSDIRNVRIYGPSNFKERLGIISFNIDGMEPHDIALTLDSEYDIAVRSGHHCALPVMKELLQMPAGTVRASTYLYNTEEEIDALIEAVKDIAKRIS